MGSAIVVDMSKLILAAVGVLAVAASIWFFRTTDTAPGVLAAPAEVNAVITVKKTGVFALSGDTKMQLFTGDAVAPGTTLVTDATGRAELSFPNGSVARLDSNTTLRLESNIHDEASGTTNVSLFLTIGRVWSRVASLATPASAWEVKTSNVVAAVRGTSFNVGVTRDNKHRVLVDTDSVLIKKANPETGAILAEVEAGEHEFTEIDARLSSALGPDLSVVPAPDAVLDDAWVRENEAADEAAETEIKQKEQAIEELAREFTEKLEEEGQSPNDYFETLETKILELQRAAKPVEEKKPEAASSPAGASPSSSTRRIVALQLAPKAPQPAYFEGSEIAFVLIATYSDGTEANVTNEATWSVRGPIGTVSRGVLAARITDPLVVEAGQANGSVVASYDDVTSNVVSILILSPAESDGGPQEG